MSNQINKINRRIQEYKDWKRNYDLAHPAKAPNHAKLDTRKRNQAKRQSRKMRGIK